MFVLFIVSQASSTGRHVLYLVLLAWLTINKTNIFFFPYFMSYTAEVVFLTINSHHCNNPTVSKDVIFFVIKMFRNVQKFSFKTACGSPCSEQIGSLI